MNNLLSNPKICVSLSGGVDSMVLLHELITLNKTNCEIIAVHINYNNRTTCDEEVKFVQRYCDALNIQLFVRHITEMTRNRDSNRKKYEEYTRCIRFEEYKRHNCPIILGHNYEDTIENIISNISSKKNYHNLKGMSYESEEREVKIIRPYLQKSKDDIYKYAFENSIPHLEDSTPKWSRRGKLRDHVIPTLEKYEPSFIKGLMCIVTCLEENREHIEKNPESVTLPSNFLNMKNALYCISNKTIEHESKKINCGQFQ